MVKFEGGACSLTIFVVDASRAVHIWLVDSNGLVLLQRRSKFKDT